VTYSYHTADVFTDVPFGGNQLAVLPDAAGLTDEQMLAITREFNLSETVFVFPPDDPKNTRRLRIYTPSGELPFAGHPTVGTAYVLAQTGEITLTGEETRIIFEEGVGPVPVLIRASAGKPVFTQLSAAKIPERRPASIDRRRARGSTLARPF
jgi:trans-2,3-dihydro-3-hydroxyanthranilate isomerase